jgi:uncharacterized protein
MKLYLSEITDSIKKKKVEHAFEGSVVNYDAKIISSDISVSFYKAGDTVSLSFKGSFEYETQCSRCAADIAVETEGQEEFYLFPEGSGDGVDYFYSGDNIDMTPFINEFFVMNIPGRVFCDENCKGVCSICGINLNDRECNCESKIS